MANRNYHVDLSNHPFCVAMKEQRLALGYSFRTLALKVGTSSRQYLAELEDGKWVMSVEMGMYLCQVLSIPTYFCIDYIKTGTIQRAEQAMTREYTMWIESAPEEVLNDLLQTEGSKMVHSAYYDKELVEC